MKRYCVYGLDRSFRFKIVARLVGWTYWTKRGNKAMAKSSWLRTYRDN